MVKFRKMSFSLLLWPNNQAREILPGISRIRDPKNFPGFRKFPVFRKVENPGKKETLSVTTSLTP